jgi:hypothetical protein
MSFTTRPGEEAEWNRGATGTSAKLSFARGAAWRLALIAPS